MANSAKGAGNILGPLFIVSFLVVAALAITFMLSEEEIPNEATVIAEDDVEARPSGAGTVPEGEQDPEMTGITDELDEVDPAAPGEETIPAAKMDAGAMDTDAAMADDATEGGATQDGDMADGAGDPATGGAADEGASANSDAASSDASTDEYLVDESTGDGASGDDVENPSVGDVPAGRDSETELTPEEDQDVVRDTDDGGTGFVPTPSGPEGRDGETIAD